MKINPKIIFKMKESEKRYQERRNKLRISRGEDITYIKERNAIKNLNFLLFLVILYLVAYIYFSFFYF